MIIHKEYGERNSIIEFSEENHEEIKKYIQELDKVNGFDLSVKYSPYNNYDCDDYLFVAWLMTRVVDCYERMNYIPQVSEWRPGYKKVPYIHVELYEGNTVSVVDGDLVPNDKKLGVGVSGPNENGCYILEMDRNYLLRYILFLADIFDQNQELFSDLYNQSIELGDGSMEVANNVLKEGPMVTREDILRTASKTLAQGAIEPAEALRNYANTLHDGEQVPMPTITFVNGKFSGLSFLDSRRTGVSIPLKKRFLTRLVLPNISIHVMSLLLSFLKSLFWQF